MHPTIRGKKRDSTHDDQHVWSNTDIFLDQKYGLSSAGILTGREMKEAGTGSEDGQVARAAVGFALEMPGRSWHFHMLTHTSTPRD